MTIYEALDKMTGFFDTLYMSDCLSDEDDELMEEIENTIYDYVEEAERRSK